ncbi:TPA: cobalamin biosynthesis protein CbiM [Candidatus Sumerlaeota bacterium]|jgi:cobalt/nickel transport system permease protein|nr:cobalamin biosynthesis protein CbiM [Candidatus Sumerlaeota bacterium]
MHMSDALISPAVGGAMWVAAAGMTAWCARRVRRDANDARVPLMGVLGAFVFSTQMLNFAIPATGSSGHLGGGLLLAILLGPAAAFLTIASVLVMQALFFADGGLLALGCNVINMGLFPCFIAYPLVYRVITGTHLTPARVTLGATLAAIVALQLGAFSVVLETSCSGVSDLPFQTFALLMQPIHLAIGLVEGLVTSAVVLFVWKASPDVLLSTAQPVRLKPVLVSFLALALLCGGVLSWFASARPDGLEWSMLHTAGKEELTAPADSLHSQMAGLQEKTVFFPDYDVKKSDTSATKENWPAVSTGKSLAGLLGGVLTLVLSGTVGFALRRRRNQTCES